MAAGNALLLLWCRRPLEALEEARPTRTTPLLPHLSSGAGLPAAPLRLARRALTIKPHSQLQCCCLLRPSLRLANERFYYNNTLPK